MHPRVDIPPRKGIARRGAGRLGAEGARVRPGGAMSKGYIARGHRPTASGRSGELIYPKSTRLHGRSISAGSPGRVFAC